MPNNHLASITSNPLFIIEAESIVTLAPICQLGCFKASAGVTFSKKARSFPRKGPPEAVKISFSALLRLSPAKHWKMAECSESTGRIATRCSATDSLTNSPATTRVSLLAKAIFFPALMAFTVGIKPLYPTKAVTTRSTSAKVTIWASASAPANTFISSCCKASRRSGYFSSLAITTLSGWNFNACSINKST